ncbi:MAG: alpha-L-fucosidase [Verrucomicrobia bacterium]|nr:alpha-L-fucosidase [Verrucomicrobiota bacterium]MCH8528654.1 alpha-L-fucosidase [Kiritimatiellia bacterium]
MTGGDETLAYQPGLFTPDWDSFREHYRVPDWFREARFGIWVHAGPQDAGMKGDWYARGLYEEGTKMYAHHLEHFGHPSVFGYKDLCNEWTLNEWDPDAMMALYKHAGAAFFVAMANHHCNFDMWDSRHQEWNSVNIGPKRDVLGDWKAAADKHGLRFGTSVHAINSWGWFDPGRTADTTGPLKGVPYDVDAATKADGAGKGWEGFDPHELYGPPHATGEDGDPPSRAFMLKFYHRTLDLIARYDIDYLYWDCHYEGARWRQFLRFEDTLPADAKRSLRETPYRAMAKTVIAHLYNLSMKRHGGTLEAVTTLKSVPEAYRGALVEDYEHHTPDSILPHVWERGYGLGGWHYAPGQYREKRTREALTLLIDVVSKNGVFLMNVPMSPRGRHDPLAVETLREIGDWMAVNGGAIRGSSPWTHFGRGNLRYTRNGDSVYVFVPADELEAEMRLVDFGSHTVSIRACEALGTEATLSWEQTPDALRITLPEGMSAEYFQVFRLGLTDVPSGF